MTEGWQAEPLISVVTVGHNQGAEMERTAQSIAAQGWRGFEWIVVDGGSLDDTMVRLEKFRPRITALLSAPYVGIHEAMNRGLSRCTGRYVLFLQAGDWFATSESLAHAARRFHLGNSPVLLVGRLQWLDPEHGYWHLLGSPFRWWNVLRGRVPPWPACFAQRLALGVLGGFSGKFGVATDTAALLALVATGGSVDHLPLDITVVPQRRSDPRFDGGIAAVRARSRAIRDLAPRWIGRTHRLLLPAWITGAFVRDVLEAVGLLSPCGRLRHWFTH